MRSQSAIARLSTLALLIAAPVAALAAQEPVAGGIIRARSGGAATIERLPVEQVRAIVAAHLPSIASGASEDNMVTLIFDSNGEFVTGGSAKVEGDVVIRAGGASAGAVAMTSGSIARTRTGGDSVIATPVVRERTQANERPAGLLQIEGVGAVDPKLIHEMYMTSYAAGTISPNPVRLRVIRLNGASIR